MPNQPPTTLPWHRECAREILRKQNVGHLPHCEICQLTQDEIASILAKHDPNAVTADIASYIQENATLRAKVAELEKENERLKSKLGGL